MTEHAPLPMSTCRIGRVEYVETARMQRSLRAAREAGAIDDVLLLLEHDPVITCGTRTDHAEIAYARTRDIPLVPVERGGKATYHGPRQVVAYPIFSIERCGGDVKQLVWRLEQAIIDTLAQHGLAGASRRKGLPGVWVDVDESGEQPGRKIASVGLRLTRGVTFHGIAVNVACDMKPFEWFTPCGIPDAVMTSLARELGREGDSGEQRDALVASVDATLEREIARRFAVEPRAVDVAQLHAVAAAHPVEDPALALPEVPAGAGAAVAARVTKIDLAGAAS